MERGEKKLAAKESGSDKHRHSRRELRAAEKAAWATKFAYIQFINEHVVRPRSIALGQHLHLLGFELDEGRRAPTSAVRM